MGYYTRFRGEIAIIPPLNYQQVKLANADVNDDRIMKVQTDSEDEETERGLLEIIYGYAIACTTDEGIRGYKAVQEIQRIVDLFPDNDFQGEIRAIGEDPGDIRRIFVRQEDRMVVEWKAKLLWPDGTTEDGRK